MAGPFESAGAIHDPTRYGALTPSAEQFAGLRTQRSPYSDGISSYLMRRFYSGIHFDQILDGINREITVNLTDKRRPGSVVYNSNTFPAAKSFDKWKYIQNGAEVLRVLMDGADGVIYDATSGQKTALMTKAAGAGAARFLGVNTELFIGDGVEQKKILRSGKIWKAATAFNVGDFILDPNGNIQSFQSQPVTLSIATIAVVNAAPTATSNAQTFLVVGLSAVPPTIPATQPVAFAGLTTYTALNGITLIYQNISTGWGLNLAPNQIAFKYNAAVSAQATDTGTAATFITQDQYGNPLNGTTGATAPASWSVTQYGVTSDGTVNWTCYGAPLQDWQVPAPNSPPIVQPTAYSLPAAGSYVCNYWRPSMSLLLNTGKSYNIIDSNGNIETAGGNGGTSPGSVQRPSSSSLITGSVVSPGNAYDTNPATFSEVTGNRTASGHCQWEGFTGVTTIFPNTLSINASVNFDDITGQASIRVSLDGGVTWSDVVVATSSVAQAIYTFPVPTGTNPGSIFIDATSVYENGPNGYYAPNVFIYDIYLTAAGSYAAVTTGKNQPNWSTSLGSLTKDNQVTWVNLGTLSTWQANYQYPLTVTILIDANGNLQYTNQFFQTTTVWTAGVAATTGAGNITGAAEPTWATTLNGTTSDGAYTWVCLGPATLLTAGTVQYAYSYHCIDGSVTTAAPGSYALNAIAGAPGLFELQVIVPASTNTQVDQIWLWRTAGGQASLLFLDAIPNNPNLGQAIYLDCIPDTSTYGQQALNAFIAAPVASANNPPPDGITGMVYHLQRTWGFVDNLVYYSGGPDTLVGNGNTAWPPLNFIAYIGKVVKLRPITVQNGGILVYTTSGIWIILGTGTSSNPFYTTIYAAEIILGGYNVEDVLGTEINLMESNGRVGSLTVTYPFNPQSGYNEVGLPIGDQFLKVTTGGINAALYNPATSYLSWNIANTQDAGMYVADGAVGWFRMSQVSPPESGLVWCPRAAIAGGTSAVQNVEVSPGVFRLLIGPPTSGGPILMRDVAQTTWTDNGTAFPAWDAKGVIPLCSTGSVSEVAWIASKSAALGSRPVVSVLMGEIAVTANTPWTVLQATSQDPADQPASQTVFSDRYTAQQGAGVLKSDAILLKFDYGSQAVADELLEFAIYGAKEEERKQQ